jgi:hypothetical protein
MRVRGRGSAKNVIPKRIDRRKREMVGGFLGGGAPPSVFCKRVRKVLIEKELPKRSFLKSAEEFENREVIFLFFLQKSERVKEEGKLNAEQQSPQRRAEDGIPRDCSG